MNIILISIFFILSYYCHCENIESKTDSLNYQVEIELGKSVGFDNDYFNEYGGLTTGISFFKKLNSNFYMGIECSFNQVLQYSEKSNVNYNINIFPILLLMKYQLNSANISIYNGIGVGIYTSNITNENEEIFANQYLYNLYFGADYRFYKYNNIDFKIGINSLLITKTEIVMFGFLSKVTYNF